MRTLSFRLIKWPRKETQSPSGIVSLQTPKLKPWGSFPYAMGTAYREDGRTVAAQSWLEWQFPKSPDPSLAWEEEEAPFASFPLTMKVLFSRRIPIPTSSSSMVSVTVWVRPYQERRVSASIFPGACKFPDASNSRFGFTLQHQILPAEGDMTMWHHP